MPLRIPKKLVVWALAALSPVVYLLDRLVPKRRDLWVFGLGRPVQWHGNAQAVYEAVRDRTDIEAVVVARRTLPPSLDTSRDRAVLGWRALPILLRAGVIVVHHGRGDLPFTGITPRGRCIVNVWHGISFKGTLYTGWDHLDRRSARDIRIRTRFFSSVIASSDIHRLAVAAGMRLPLGRIWITGLPRNDWLLAPEEELPSDVADAIERLRSELDGRLLVLYAPTFRDEGSGVYPFTPDERDALQQVLEGHGAVLGMRTHMNEAGASELASERWALDISPSRFPETQAVLRLTDVLVSDYSSIWIDFLLLDRPIVGFVHDLEAYRARRRLLYDIERVYGGPLVSTGLQLIATLDAVLAGREEDVHARLRQTALRIYHRYSDGHATDRTVRRILEEAECRHDR